MTRVSAIVLAGGRSRRFGSDKRRAPVDGEPLVHRAIRVAAQVADEVVVVLAPGEEIGLLLGAPLDPAVPPPVAGPIDLGILLVVANDPVAHEGPLAGLVAGLAVAHGELVIVVAGDMPSLEPAVLRALLECAAAEPGPWILETPAGSPPAILPLAGRRAPLRAAADTLLASGERRLRSLLPGSGGRTLPAVEWLALDPAGRTLRDIDVPEDAIDA